MSTDLERFLATDGRADAIQRVRADIDAKGITYIYYQFASVTGRIMGKGVPADHWETIAQRGFQLVYGSTANLFTDRHGNYIGYGPEAWELVGLCSYLLIGFWYLEKANADAGKSAVDTGAQAQP